MHKRRLIFCVLVSAACLMAVEFGGQRLLAVHLGDGLPVWGAAISVVLGAMAAGYSIGGRLADRYTSEHLLAGSLGLASAYTVGLAAWGDDLASVAGGIGDLRLASLVGSLLLLLIPSILLGATSPIAARLRLHGIEDAGARSSDAYALGSVGSVVGALGATFWGIEALGVPGLLAFSGVLLAVGAALVAPSRRATRIPAITWMLCSILLAVAYMGSSIGSQPGVTLEERESPLGHLRVYEEAGVRTLQIGSLEHTGQSIAHPDRPVYEYAQVMQRTMCLSPEGRAPQRVLLIGVGGGTLVRTTKRLYPQTHIDAVDIDGDVLDLAHRWFQPPREGVDYIVEDGRRFLNRTRNRYDLIILDAYSGDRLPSHLLTSEFYELTASRLSPGGQVVSNVIARPGGKLAASVLATQQAALGPMTVLDSQPGYTASAHHNLIYLSAGARTDEECLDRVARDLGMPRKQLDVPAVPIDPSRGRILTDARPAVALASSND